MTDDELKPYRVEWRSSLTTRFLLLASFDKHEEANEALKKWGGQTRVISQHVIAIEGLGGG